jgi:hypothetical protein
MAKVDKSDSFPGLRRPEVGRRFVEREVVGGMIGPGYENYSSAPILEPRGAPTKECEVGGPVAQPSEPEPAPKIKRAQAALAGAGKKIGRPKRADKPWVKDGISKSLWYRREKERREASGG